MRVTVWHFAPTKRSYMQGESIALRFYGYFLERSDWQPGALGMPDQKEMQVRVKAAWRAEKG